MYQKTTSNSQAIETFFKNVKKADLAAILRSIETDKTLLSARESTSDFTAIHYAIMQNRLDILEALIKAGSPLDIKVNYLNEERTLIQFIDLHAKQENKDMMIRMLKPVEALVMQLPNISTTVEHDEIELIHISREQLGEDLFLQEKKGLVYKLAEAGEKGFEELIALLDKHPGFLLLKNEERNSLQHVAVLTDNLQLLKYLIANKVELNIKNNNNGATPLHYAVAKQNLEMVELLLRNGARLDMKDNEHRIPLQLSKNSKISELLTKNTVEKGESKTIPPSMKQHPTQSTAHVVINTAGFSPAKLKLIQRRTSIKLKAADVESKTFNRIIKLFEQFDAKQISSFDLLKGISQNIRSLPEGNLKDRHTEIKWKYLIQLLHSLVKLKDSKSYMCDLIIKHDLPNIRSLCENLIDEVKKQQQELANIYRIITLQIDSILPTLISEHFSLSRQIDIIKDLLSIIESIEALKNSKGDKSLLINKKIEDLQAFCLKNSKTVLILEFAKQVFDKSAEESLKKISLAKNQIETSLYKLEAERVSINTRINIITNNDDIQKADIRILQEIREKLKSLITKASLPKPNETILSAEIVILKAHLLRLSGIGEGSAIDFSTEEIKKIIIDIQNISDDSQKINIQFLKMLDTSIDKLIRSLGKNPYEDDMNALHSILAKLVSLHANLAVGLKYKPDDKQLVNSLSGELKHLQKYLEAIINNGKEGKPGLLKKFPEANELINAIFTVSTQKHPLKLQGDVGRLIKGTCKLLSDINSNNISATDIALFDITKELANLLRKGCTSGTETTVLQSMLTELQQYAIALPDESDLMHVKQIMKDLKSDENIDIDTTLRLLVQILPPLELLKKARQSEKTQQSEAISKFVNKLSEIQKYLLTNEVYRYGIKSLIDEYTFKSKQVWKDSEIIEKFQSLLNGSPSQLGSFLHWVKLFHETTATIQDYKTLQNTRARKKEIISLPVINTFIGFEYDRANLNVVIKYLNILLKHDPKSRATRAGMLATLLIMGEAFKDLSISMKKEGVFKNWYSFYAMRNAIHSILGEDGRKKFQQLLEAKDSAFERLFIDCFENLSVLKDQLIILVDKIPTSHELISTVESNISSPPEETKKELAEINLPPGLIILHQYLTQPGISIQIDKSKQLSLMEVERNETTEEKVVNSQKSLVDDTIDKALAAQSLNALIISIEAESKFLETYCMAFSTAPEIYSLACEFSVAYCGDIVRKLLDVQEYCDHLNEYFLNMHYQIKSERGDLMHDRVLKSEKFDQQDPRYLWVVNELSPCTIIALNSMKLSIIGQDIISKAENEFISLNQTFNKSISPPFNRIKLFLEAGFGKIVLDDLLEHPDKYDSSLIKNKLHELDEMKKLELFSAITYLLSDASDQMKIDFENKHKKLEHDIRSRFNHLNIITHQIQQLQEYSKINHTDNLEVYATDIIKDEIDILKIQLLEQQESLKKIIEHHIEHTLTKNLDKFNYFPIKLLQKLKDTLKEELKIDSSLQQNITASVTDNTSVDDKNKLRK